MPVLCAIVARLADATVLSSKVLQDSGFDIKQLDEIVEKAKGKTNSRLSFTQECYGYHYNTDENIAVVISTDGGCHRKFAYQFMDDVKKQFKRMYVEPVHTLCADTCVQFNEVLEEYLTKYSKIDDGSGKMREIRESLEQVKGVMVQNIDKVIERGGRIETIVERTEELDDVADGFRRSSRTLRRKVWWQGVRMKIIIAGSIVLFAVVVSMIFCGGPDYSGCR
ncbi:Vesicle-associated membrane protein 713 [Diplonema papillatum]|nr:Vesicle-associated membrane protein 713 [Diplonema papillatum]KAJ9440761.1 Vesicle-associated membrane protein 713 [Diplonema papillatum]